MSQDFKRPRDHLDDPQYTGLLSYLNNLKQALMLDDYADALEASRVLGVHPKTVKLLIREGKLPATKFGNKWLVEKHRLHAFAGGYDPRKGRPRLLL